jgi:hypothetical protein
VHQILSSSQGRRNKEIIKSVEKNNKIREKLSLLHQIIHWKSEKKTV